MDTEIFKKEIALAIKNGESKIKNLSEIKDLLSMYMKALKESVEALVKKGTSVRVEFHEPCSISSNLENKFKAISKRKDTTIINAFAFPKEDSDIYTISINFNNELTWTEVVSYAPDPIHAYPCSIVFKDINIPCKDKEEIVSALMKATDSLGSDIFRQIKRFA